MEIQLTENAPKTKLTAMTAETPSNIHKMIHIHVPSKAAAADSPTAAAPRADGSRGLARIMVSMPLVHDSYVLCLSFYSHDNNITARKSVCQRR